MGIGHTQGRGQEVGRGIEVVIKDHRTIRGRKITPKISMGTNKNTNPDCKVNILKTVKEDMTTILRNRLTKGSRKLRILTVLLHLTRNIKDTKN